MEVNYISHMGDDLMVANAARVSFNKHKEAFDEQDAKLIQYLASHGHWTPFGHPTIALRMKAPVPIRTQCFKHKVGFIENEVSRRYVDDEPELFIPEWRGKPTNGAKQGSSGLIDLSNIEKVDGPGEAPYYIDLGRWYEVFLHEALELYNEMIDAGVAPEQARFVLPQAMYTEWYWTGSLAAYARFANLRLDPHAQREVQDLAKMVSAVIQPLFPISWEALTSR